MKWIRKLFGLKTVLEKKKDKLASLREKAFQAQSVGDLRAAGRYLHEVEILETAIFDAVENENENK